MVRLRSRPAVAAAIRLLLFWFPAALAGTAFAQATPSQGALTTLKPATQLAAPPSKAQSAPAAQPRPPAPAVAPLALSDIAKRTAAELDALIAAQRDVIKIAAADETARRNLGLISIDAANRILRAEALGGATLAASYKNLIKTALADTFWRVTQLVREEPARAQAALGLYYADGILVPADAARSCDYFAKAAGAAQVDAAFRAAQCVEKTQPERARQWLEQSAAGGNPAAAEKLGRACIERASIDIACAKRWLQPAAAQGRVSAISVLAWLYVREGTAQSLSQASILYRSAAEAGDFAAQNNLGELFELGRGVAKDPAQAYGWYQKSAENGFAPAQFNLARLLAFGVGTERNTPEAREWAEKAQAQGVAQAAELLKLIADAEKSR
jgi:TPR repeat protein